MSKTMFWVLGLVVLSAIGVWMASNYVNITPLKGPIASAKPDHANGADLHNDVGIGSILKDTAKDLDAEARVGLHNAELPVPPTVETLTTARLKNTGLPQTIHGILVGFEKYERMLQPGEKPLRIHARGSDGRTASISAILDGKYSLGPLPEGANIVFLDERNQLPGLVMRIGVAQNQQAKEIDFSLGECELVVTVLDENGSKLQSDAIELMVGGTDDDKHTYKRAKSIQNGTWHIRGLLPGQYIASAKIGDSNGGAMPTLKPGSNSCTIQVRPQAIRGNGPQNSR